MFVPALRPAVSFGVECAWTAALGGSLAANLVTLNPLVTLGPVSSALQRCAVRTHDRTARGRNQSVTAGQRAAGPPEAASPAPDHRGRAAAARLRR
ncbi:hypothetical protein GCM10023328_36140 [Modestobacter marinus]|uniref:Uncharacterized protein n=1 Tax=Modestobacter marinus TaxID=477641 RepID=A0A846LT48_9ACTN|nr:hypothetical protein [Modestobacter marinus]GGL74201.1 hypothetical protein GCM10011589_32830 [Modestobacter marinus]